MTPSIEELIRAERKRLETERTRVIMAALDGVPSDHAELSVSFRLPQPVIVPDVGQVTRVRVRRTVDRGDDSEDGGEWDSAEGYGRALKADGTVDLRVSPYWSTLPTALVGPLLARYEQEKGT